MTSVSVLGSNGMLGHAVYNVLYRCGFEVLPVTRDNLKHTSLDTEYVINCIGITKQREKESTPEVMAYTNSVFPIEIARTCNKFGAKLIHISTDCVFDGKIGEGKSYTEASVITANDLYGITKAAGEAADAMVIRTSIIGDELPESKKEGRGLSLFEWVRSKEGQTVNGYIDHYWNGVTTYQLATSIVDIIKRKYYNKGLFQIHSPETVTKYELVKMISEIFELNIDVVKTSNVQVNRALGNITPLCNMLEIPSLRQQLLNMKTILTK